MASAQCQLNSAAAIAAKQADTSTLQLICQLAACLQPPIAALCLQRAICRSWPAGPLGAQPVQLGVQLGDSPVADPSCTPAELVAIAGAAAAIASCQTSTLQGIAIRQLLPQLLPGNKISGKHSMLRIDAYAAIYIGKACSA